MKKKIAVIGALLLAVSFGFFIYNKIVVKVFRYSTPEEAFFNSSYRNYELTDILEDQNVALLIYKSQDGKYSDHIIAKDTGGWTPLAVDYRNKRQILQDNVFIYLKDVQGKNVIQIVTIVEKGEEMPELSDSAKSDFLSTSYEISSGRRLLYGFLVSDEKIQENYRIRLGEQEIAIN